MISYYLIIILFAFSILATRSYLRLKRDETKKTKLVFWGLVLAWLLTSYFLGWHVPGGHYYHDYIAPLF